MDKIKIFLTNLGRYNEGCLMGEWVKLPVPEDKLEDILARIGINGEYEEYFITDFESTLANLCISEYARLDVLNELAEKIEELSDDEYEKLTAVLESESPTSICAILEIIERLDEYDLYTEVEDDESLGWLYAEMCGTFDSIPENLRYYLDMEKFGRDLRMELDLCYTSYGVVVRNH